MSSANVHAVGPFDDFVSGTATRVDVDGVPIAVVRIDDDVYAIGDICSHANVSLSGGEVWCAERELECPRHGSTFSLLTGEPDTLPATQPVPVFDASVVDGNVVISIETAGEVSGNAAPHAAAPDDAASDDGGASR